MIMKGQVIKERGCSDLRWTELVLNDGGGIFY
jgi:hypothetical protein